MTPLPLVPMALFVTLSILALVIWTGVRSQGELRGWLLLLLGLMVIPIFSVFLLSRILAPVYLDRSFSLVAPAYVLLLGWGMAHPPRNSPLRLLYGGLVFLVALSLGNHYLNADPAKPPFRDVAGVIREGWQEGDVLFHLHDSSYLPLLYYAPQVDSYLLNNDPHAWLLSSTWEWAGRRVSALNEVVVGKSRLWLVLVPGRTSDQQVEVLDQVDASYERMGQWSWPALDSVELRLYSLGDVCQP